LTGLEGCRMLMLQHEAGKVVSPTHRPPLSRVLISVRGWVDRKD